jgi:hypothetical protein
MQTTINGRRETHASKNTSMPHLGCEDERHKKNLKKFFLEKLKLKVPENKLNTHLPRDKRNF